MQTIEITIDNRDIFGPDGPGDQYDYADSLEALQERIASAVRSEYPDWLVIVEARTTLNDRVTVSHAGDVHDPDDYMAAQEHADEVQERVREIIGECRADWDSWMIESC